jgi:hypothetical protein
MAVARDGFGADPKGLLVRERYVDLVHSFPQVRRVLPEATPSGPRIWTVIEVEPFDRDQREPLYAAELAATGAAPELDIDFRVVNVVEYGSSRTGIVPDGAVALWHR